MTVKRLLIAGLCAAPLLLLSSHCDRDNSEPPIQVYKSKADYSEYVPVQLSKDRTKITSKPGSSIDERPMKLVNEYFLGCTMGLYTGYLSLTYAEYDNIESHFSLDSLYNLLLEKDPFLEYYEAKKNNDLIDGYNAYFGIDTSFINQLIIEDRLEEYFVRLK